MKKTLFTLFLILTIVFNLEASQYNASKIGSALNPFFSEIGLNPFSWNPVGYMYDNKIHMILSVGFDHINAREYLSYKRNQHKWQNDEKSQFLENIHGDAISCVPYINENENEIYFFVTHYSNKHGYDKDDNRISIFKNDTYQTTLDETSYIDGQALIYRGKVVLIYISHSENSIKALWTEDDGKNWNVNTIVNNITIRKYNSRPMLTACVFRDVDSTDKILIVNASTGKLSPVVYYVSFDKNGDIRTEKKENIFSSNSIKSSTQNYYIKDITSVQGSVSEGKPGNNIQIFTAHWDYKHFQFVINRYNFNVDDAKINNFEQIPYRCNGIPNQVISLVPFTLISKYDGNNFQKDIGVCGINIERSSYVNPANLYYHILTWSSDKIELDELDVETEVIQDSSLWKLIGVIEGPPPFILNGWEYDYTVGNPNKIPNHFLPLSTLSYGVKNSSSNTRSHTIKVSIESENNIMGFLFGGGYEHNKEFSEKIERTIDIDFNIEPSVGEALGYYLVLKPDITRRKYYIKDHEGNIINTFYKFLVSDMHYAMMPFNMNDEIHKLNPYNIASYMDRGYNLAPYNKIFSIGWQAANGVSNDISYEISETMETVSEKEFNIYFGIEKDIDIPIFGPVFQTKNKFNYGFSWKVTTESTRGQNLEIMVQVPDPNPNTTVPKDTNEYSGKFYWIKETDGMPNWWIPKDGPFKGQKPWCMTWEVTEIRDQDIEGMVLSVDSKEKSELNIYPNPTNKDLYFDIELTDVNPLTVYIYNELGIKVKETRFNNIQIGMNKLRMTVSDLNSGAYNIHIVGQNINKSGKFIVY